MKQIAAIYVRVSTDEQAKEGYSISAQIDVLTQYCKLFNIELYKVYKELGVSGKDTRNREALQQMINDSKEKKFNTVLVWKISRLSRSLKDLLTMLDNFENDGISLISYSEKFDTSTPVGRMTLQILGSIAEFERNTIVENVKLGLGEIARSGRKTGGIVIGYDNVDKNLVINEKEAEIVRYIFDLYVNKKYGLVKIVKTLNEMGYRTKRGNKFSKSTVGIILANPVYIAKNRFGIGTENYHEIDAIHEPIIDEELFDKAQQRRKQRHSIGERRHEEGKFLLSGLINCPFCGYSMVGGYSISRKKLKDGYKKYRYAFYKCNRFDTIRDCKSNFVSAAKIEASIEQYISKICQDPVHIKNILKENEKESKEKNKPIDKELKQIISKINELNESKERYFNLFESGKLKDNNVFIERLNNIETQIGILLNKKESLEMNKNDFNIEITDDKTILNLLKNFSELIETAEYEDKKELLRAYIKTINLNKDKTINSIEFLFPFSGRRILKL